MFPCPYFILYFELSPFKHQLSDSIAIDGFGWQKHEVHPNNRNANKVKEFRIVFRGRAASGNDFYLDNIAITDGTIEEQYPAVTDLTGEVTASPEQIARAIGLSSSRTRVYLRQLLQRGALVRAAGYTLPS